MIATAIGWIATAFRASGMLSKDANKVKYLVSVGNVFWLVNGILTDNIPLIAKGCHLCGCIGLRINKEMI